MPGFSFRHTEFSQEQDSGSFWNSGASEGQQYSSHDPVHSHNGFDAFGSFPIPQMNQNGQRNIQSTVSGKSGQWSVSPAHADSEQMSRLPSQDSTGAHSQKGHRALSFDQPRSSRLYGATPQISYISSARSDVTGRSSPVDPGLYTPIQQMELPTFDNFHFSGPEDISGGQSTFHRDSVSGLPHSGVSLTTGPSFDIFSNADDTFASLSNGSNNLTGHVPVSRDSMIFNPSTIIDSHSPTIWNENMILESQRSSPSLHEDWVLPLPQMTTSATNSPIDYSPSLEGLSPRYVPDFPDLVDLAPYTTCDRVVRKPVGPRLSKVASDLATRHQGTSETSDESFRMVGRSSLEIDNTARDHPLYQNVIPMADGLYHCPWEGQETCQHKPEKLKCNYDKFVDSHLKPYRCKVVSCENSRFSSTACLLRHEREAHAMHGHGDKPYLCTYEGCDRGVTGNGFPRHWNLRDHMKRVHNDGGISTKSNASGSPPPSNVPIRGKKRKVEDNDGPFVDKAMKRIATPPIAASRPQEPSLVDRYLQSERRLQDIVKQFNGPMNANNMTLLRNAGDCIKVMVQMTQRINGTTTNLGQQQID